MQVKDQLRIEVYVTTQKLYGALVVEMPFLANTEMLMHRKTLDN